MGEGRNPAFELLLRAPFDQDLCVCSCLTASVHVLIEAVNKNTMFSRAKDTFLRGMRVCMCTCVEMSDFAHDDATLNKKQEKCHPQSPSFPCINTLCFECFM